MWALQTEWPWKSKAKTRIVFFSFQYGETEQLARVSFNGEVREERVSDGRGQDLLVVRHNGRDLPNSWYSQLTGNCTQVYDK